MKREWTKTRGQVVAKEKVKKSEWEREHEWEQKSFTKILQSSQYTTHKGGRGSIYGGVMIELYVRMAEWGQYHAKSNITENEVIRNDG